MADVGAPDPEAAAAQRVNGRIEAQLDALRAAGQLAVGSGCLQAGSTTLAFHTDPGPEGQDKDCNQDYALGWASSPDRDGPEPIVALAIADGLTSSYRSEWAAGLACAVALRALADQLRTSPAETGDARDHARIAFAAAGRAIVEVAASLSEDPAKSCPPGQFLSTWKYILRRGLFLQTTLTLAWVQGDVFRVAMIGDSGVFLRRQNSDHHAAAADEELAQVDPTTNEVNALGPNAPPSEHMDVWRERPWVRQCLCALYSDGIGRGLQRAGVPLLDSGTYPRASQGANQAQEFIRRIVESRNPAFDDNLTLAFLLRE